MCDRDYLRCNSDDHPSAFSGIWGLTNEREQAEPMPPPWLSPDHIYPGKERRGADTEVPVPEASDTGHMEKRRGNTGDTDRELNYPLACSSGTAGRWAKIAQRLEIGIIVSFKALDSRIVIAVSLVVLSLVFAVVMMRRGQQPADVIVTERGIGQEQPIYLPFVQSAQAAEPTPQPIESPAIRRVNEVRVAEGLAPLAVSPELTRAAQAHAEDMAAHDYLDHNSIDGTNWAERIIKFYPDWRALGENIAAGYNTEESMMQGWLESPGHYANIVNGNFTEVGLGYATGGSYGHYWVMDFGRREIDTGVSGFDVSMWDD